MLNNTVYTASELQSKCGQKHKCVIPHGATLYVDGNINVAALVIYGNLIWTDETSVSDHFLCAGYITVVDGGIFFMNISWHKAYIFIKVLLNNSSYTPDVELIYKMQGYWCLRRDHLKLKRIRGF